jgi:hypothetical protein
MCYNAVIADDITSSRPVRLTYCHTHHRPIPSEIIGQLDTLRQRELIVIMFVSRQSKSDCLLRPWRTLVTSISAFASLWRLTFPLVLRQEAGIVAFADLVRSSLLYGPYSSSCKSSSRGASRAVDAQQQPVRASLPRCQMTDMQMDRQRVVAEMWGLLKRLLHIHSSRKTNERSGLYDPKPAIGL